MAPLSAFRVDWRMQGRQLLHRFLTVLQGTVSLVATSVLGHCDHLLPGSPSQYDSHGEGRSDFIDLANQIKESKNLVDCKVLSSSTRRQHRWTTSEGARLSYVIDQRSHERRVWSADAVNIREASALDPCSCFDGWTQGIRRGQEVGQQCQERCESSESCQEGGKGSCQGGRLEGRRRRKRW